jgi:MoaA/NifB/PqqE/SkfB family radical SAM enzyme
MPTVIGNIFKSPITEILSGNVAKTLRQSIIDGSYEYCNENACGIIRHNQLNDRDALPPKVSWQIKDSSRFVTPYEIVLAGDKTCNLSCPSCRTSVFKSNDEFKEKQEQLGELLRKNLFSQPTDDAISLTVSTTGEVFASPLLLRFVSSIDVNSFPNLELTLQTNGLLAPEFWHKLGNMQHKVKKTTVTVDASRPETYEKLRRGGAWKDIVFALNWFKNKKSETGMKLNTRIVVQVDNINQLDEFYHFSKQFDVDVVEYCRIGDWGKMTNFHEVDALDINHPRYHEAKQALDQVLQYQDTMAWG